ncbi:hypothetical protein HZF08_06025 [Paenibacillus sp. CGMCC 1.16610]|uniref:Flagellar hook-length control protein FliK n=1 Tax=Paenibacillus anseongense TaxID=2682845 RepID=A0ABW9UGB7_9BACL|nr:MULTISPECIES: hypothetical protein [Paenibacillus]MBA2937857.1 hypothetical protein [Paenibacillus sp. CGMCC 1.16610]MVQ36915.1 hypothetical protein [Paenibacillus anseongense]
MNISGLIRSLVGDLTASDSKVLELKVGQVVKGVVLQLLSDQEALLNISGVQVRAKLETPLKQGDVTYLQVQPESSGGQIMMKPLTASDVQITEDSLADLLKAFSVKDTAGNRQMVQLMQQEGVPVSKETVKAFETLMSNIPEGVNKEEWAQAAVLAHKKGLPLTQETVGALRQVTSGPPVGKVLEQLEQQAAKLLEQQPEHPAADTAKQVVAVLRELRASAAAVWPARPPEAPAAAAPPAAAQAGASGTAAPAEPPPRVGSAPGAAAVTAPPDAAGGELAAAPAQPAAEPQAARTARAAMPEAQARSAVPAPEGEPPVAGSPVQEPPAKQKAAEPLEARRSAPQEPEADPEPNWISRMLKAVGVEHEAHLAAKLDERGEVMQRGRLPKDDQLPNLIAMASQQDDTAKPAAAETLKSLLLQLTASSDTPAPLREAAQQAVGQITGQQLMLTGDKTAMFAHMTLFIPFMDGTGQQSAAVHIQSHKGKRGEVDASNCRLLFDLQMKVMGNTLVDVHVVNKIVSLTIHNDHPALAPMMEESKEEITSAMNKAGYQFISLKCSPYPQPVSNEDEGKVKGVTDGRADLRSLYLPKTYKGVDFRA